MMRLQALVLDGQEFTFTQGSNPGIYISDNIDGLDTPEFFEDTEALTGQYGDAIYNNLYRGRNIVIRGHISKNDSSLYEGLRKTLVSLAAINKDSSGQIIYKRLTIETTGGSTYFTEGTVRLQMPWVAHTHAPYMLFLHCPDPILYGDYHTSGLVTRPAGGGVMIPAMVPFTLSGGGGGSAILVNGGNGPTWPILVLRGPLTSPRIYSQTLDRAFKLNYTLGVNDEVRINTSPFYETVLRNQTDNFITYVDDNDRDMFQLEPGNNIITFSTNDPADTGSLEVLYYDGFIGI